MVGWRPILGQSWIPYWQWICSYLLFCDAQDFNYNVDLIKKLNMSFEKTQEVAEIYSKKSTCDQKLNKLSMVMILSKFKKFTLISIVAKNIF